MVLRARYPMQLPDLAPGPEEGNNGGHRPPKLLKVWERVLVEWCIVPCSVDLGYGLLTEKER